MLLGTQQSLSCISTLFFKKAAACSALCFIIIIESKTNKNIQMNERALSDWLRFWPLRPFSCVDISLLSVSYIASWTVQSVWDWGGGKLPIGYKQAYDLIKHRILELFLWILEIQRPERPLPLERKVVDIRLDISYEQSSTVLKPKGHPGKTWFSTKPHENGVWLKLKKYKQNIQIVRYL